MIARLASEAGADRAQARALAQGAEGPSALGPSPAGGPERVSWRLGVVVPDEAHAPGTHPQPLL